MCGIAGYVCPAEPLPSGEAVLRQMLGMIRHRGPDQFGIYLGDEVGLGSARLSIIDLAGGQQPIANEDGSLWIVFNGEVFNYIELREQLENLGHQFRTQTDTEVVLHLFEEHGRDCLHFLNGQFAFAIWNESERVLFLARDRVGVRPLFYARTRDAFVFASEIKSLLAYPGVSASVDPVALDQVFTYWTALSPRTFFRGIHEVPPGHFLVLKDGRIEAVRWWLLEFHQSPAERSDEDYVEELGSLLRDATRLRLRADVRVGAYLSGGVDSATVAGMIKDLQVGHLDTFSISFADSRYDEGAAQRKLADFLGTEHQVVYATCEDVGRVFPDVIWHTETAILRTAPAPMFLLSKLVRDQSYKVVLTGEGADEFFAGYDIFKETRIRQFWSRMPDSVVRPLLLRRLYPDIPDLRRTGDPYLAAFFGRDLLDTCACDYSHIIRWRNGGRLRHLLSDEVLQEAKRSQSNPVFPEGFSSWDLLQRAQYIEITTFLSQYLLSSQGDRVAMAHSVEGRHPFLDSRVMEFCTRLPGRAKMRGLRDKIILRKAGRPFVPRDVATRPKRPYRAPIRKCFFNESQCPYIPEVLAPSAIATAGMFKAGAVERLLVKARSDRPLGEIDEMALVGIISAQLLFRRFVSGFHIYPSISKKDSVKLVDRRHAFKTAKAQFSPILPSNS